MFARLFRPPLLFALAALCLVSSVAIYPAHADTPGGAVTHAVGDAGAVAVAAPSDKGIGTSPSVPTALPDPGTPGELASGIAGAARAGKWMLLIALIVNCAVWAIRRFTPFILQKLGAWFGEDRGGTVLALLTGMLTVLVIQLQTGHVDPWLIVDGAAVGLLGVGNYTAPKKLAPA
jgi:hypothetical protein